MRRAIVHIGMPRTGTGSLQAVLSAYRGELAQAGVLYPGPLCLGAAFDGRRPRHELRELLAMLDRTLATSAGDLVILSDPGLSQLPFGHRACRTLRELFERHGFRMEIAVTLKSQDLYAQSCYAWRCQLLREPSFFADSLAAILRQRCFNYLASVRPWAIAADGHVVAVPVHERGSSEPLIGRLLSQLGLAERIGPHLQSRDLLRWDNRSMSAPAIEIARRIRARSGAPREPAHAREITDFITTEVGLRGFASTPFQGLDPATRARVMAGFIAGNDRFARGIWGENWSRRVADVELAPPNALGPDSPPDYVDAQLESVVLQVSRHFGLPSGYGLRARARALLELPRNAYRHWH